MTSRTASSRKLPSLPRTFRPRWGRIVPWTLGLVVLAAAVVLAVVLPASWTAADRVLMVATGLLIAEFLRRLGDVRVRADDSGLLVANILAKRRLEWAEVVSLRLAEGDPWLVFDLSDGTTLPAMGVQGSEGAYARHQAAELAALVATRSTTMR